MWLLGLECKVAALKRLCRAGGLFFFFFFSLFKRKGKTAEADAVPRMCVSEINSSTLARFRFSHHDPLLFFSFQRFNLA